MPFQVDSYTSQSHDGRHQRYTWSRRVCQTGRQEGGGQVNIQKNDQYSILTMELVEKELPGDWELVYHRHRERPAVRRQRSHMKNGNTKRGNSEVPIHEPIDLSVEMTGESSDEMIVQVIISKNDGSDFEVIPLEWKDRQYVGTYETLVHQLVPISWKRKS